MLKAALKKTGAVPKVVGVRGGQVISDKGNAIAVDHPLLTVASTLFDAVAIPGGPEHVSALSGNPKCVAFVAEAFQHLKGIYAAADATPLLEDAGVADADNKDQSIPGVVITDNSRTAAKDVDAFIAVLAQHRVWDRVRKARTDHGC